MVFVVEEFLIDIRDYNVSRLVKYKTPTESYSGSKTVQIGINTSAIIFLQNKC